MNPHKSRSTAVVIRQLALECQRPFHMREMVAWSGVNKLTVSNHMVVMQQEGFLVSDSPGSKGSRAKLYHVPEDIILQQALARYITALEHQRHAMGIPSSASFYMAQVLLDNALDTYPEGYDDFVARIERLLKKCGGIYELGVPLTVKLYLHVEWALFESYRDTPNALLLLKPLTDLLLSIDSRATDRILEHMKKLTRR